MANKGNQDRISDGDKGRMAMSMYDMNGDGVVDKDEFRQKTKEMSKGAPIDDAMLDIAFSMNDVNGNGVLEASDFEAMMKMSQTGGRGGKADSRGPGGPPG